MASSSLIFILVTLIAGPALGFRIYPLNENADQTRIIGGYDANAGDFPHQVQVRIFTTETEDGYYLCGGIIIGECWVLTAGHCLEPDGPFAHTYYTVIAGRNTRTAEIPGLQQIRNSTKSYIHPLFFGDPLTLYFGYDVGLIKLAEAFALNNYVDIICFTPKHYSIHADKPDVVLISGWGVTEDGDVSEILQFLQVTIKSDTDCASEFPLVYDPHQNVCVGKTGETACNGDSGGPLTISKRGAASDSVSVINKHRMVAGITSKGAAGCTGSVIYTKISRFAYWIEKTSGIKPCSSIA